MNVGDRMFNGMLRGFAYTTGRRAAYRLPLWLAILVVLAIYFLQR